MAWKNLDRNRPRTVIIISAIFFAVVLSVTTSSLRAGIFENLVDNITRAYTGKIQIHATGYWNEPSLDKLFTRDMFLEESLRIRSGMRGVLPRLESFSLVAAASRTKGAQLVGVDPEAEDRISALTKKMRSGTFLRATDRGICVAAGLLRRLDARLGDTLVLLGQGYQGAIAAGKYPVNGILHFGSPELNDHLIYMPIIQMQEFLQATDMLSAYALEPLNADHLDRQVDSLRSWLGPSFEVMAWMDMLPDIQQHIQTDTRNMRIVQWILYLLVGFGIFGTLLMLISERMQEFGMLLALGLQKIQLGAVLVLETIFVFGLGVLFGLIASAPLLYFLHTHPIRIGGNVATAYERFGFEAVFPAAWEFRHFWEQGLIVCSMGALLSLYLVFSVFRLDPIKAMR